MSLSSSPSNSSCGPLPKSDSVQSLVSLMSCPSPAPLPTLDHATIRGVDADAQSHCKTVAEDAEVITLSGLNLHSISLGALASPASANLRELSLAANSLDSVDLAPLSWCANLVVLTLNSNRLSRLDISPLASCKRLERLWLHDNCLENIDLSPLSPCSALRSLYLEDNSIHHSTLNLSPLESAVNLRSLRIGGNRLNSQLDVSALLRCSSLSIFRVDSSVNLSASGDSVQARVSPALRRMVLDIKFSPPDLSKTSSLSSSDALQQRPSKGRTTPPVSPRSSSSHPQYSRKTTPPCPPTKPHQVMSAKHSSNPNSRSTPSPPSVAPSGSHNSPAQHVVKILLIGFRRLARYAAEDSFAKCGKVIIRASDQSVATQNPSLLLESHLVLIYAPSEKTVRQITLVTGRIPTVVIGSERYRTSADNKLLDALERYRFYSDPMDDADTKTVYLQAKRYASGESTRSPNSSSRSSSAKELSFPHSLPMTEEGDHDDASAKAAIRKSSSDTSILSSSEVGIELEDIDDLQKAHSSGSLDGQSGSAIQRVAPMKGWEGLFQRLSDHRKHRAGIGCAPMSRSESSLHGRSKLRAEQSAIEASFRELGGYATLETCGNIARACGLPKCAGPLLFRASFGSTFEVEATTPEAGVPNAPMERMKRISVDSFLAYWSSKLNTYDGEERLSHVLQDSHFSRLRSNGGRDESGHSMYGARLARPASCGPRLMGNASASLDSLRGFGSRSLSLGAGPGDSSGSISADLWCPCDAGIEELIRTFMEGRRSRFGSYALVKMPEAIAIGSSLVMFELRSVSQGRVGGRARPVCPREVIAGKLNAALIAAEVGIFEGVAAALSMNQIRSVKGCFATEISPGSVSHGVAYALNFSLSLEEVQQFCVSRKTLLPGAVEHAMRSHCRNSSSMTLSEFAVLLSVLGDISSDGSIDYLFTVVDVDQNERWTLPDLREFHMEKEKMYNEDGMAVNDLTDLWFNLVDMIGISGVEVRKGVSRRHLFSLGVKERKAVIQGLLFVDDDYSSLHIRRTMELNNSTTSVVL